MKRFVRLKKNKIKSVTPPSVSFVPTVASSDETDKNGFVLLR